MDEACDGLRRVDALLVVSIGVFFALRVDWKGFKLVLLPVAPEALVHHAVELSFFPDYAEDFVEVLLDSCFLFGH